MFDAGTVGDDERGSGERLGFLKGLDGLGILGAKRDLRHVSGAVSHRDQAKVLPPGAFAGHGEFGRRAPRR